MHALCLPSCFASFSLLQVDWHITPRVQLFLHLMRRRQGALEQRLNVWVCRRRFVPGETFTLYGAEGTAELTDRSYVVAFK